MSRIGKKPISVPQGVKVALDGAIVRAEGPKGKLSQAIPSGVSVTMDSNVLTVARSSDHRNVRALHGLTRSLVANMIHGVKDGFERKLEIVGIGYRCQLQAEVERQVSITLRGADKALLGQTAAKLRALRKPDPYKGKGIKYSDEYIRRKVGKKAGAK
jgi:large subunit ribosomal protein L6